jgi:4-diphosphocytidyl-2-C-methyl-D-erythritol kinase
MSELTVDACAKINLTLEVVRRLPDGYHEIRTVFQQVNLCDELALADSASDGITISCDDTGLDAGPSNLVWRAADLMQKRFCPRRGVRVHVHKRIPIGGGLGGGSADAAATLVGLNRLWSLGLSRQDLMDLALQLGMDVPFCVLGGTALGAGRGEILEPLPALPALDVVIAHAGVESSTAEAYAALRPEHMGGGRATAAMAQAIKDGDISAVAAGLYDVFEKDICRRLPQVGRIKRIMLESGAWNAALTGSGACVFALAHSAAKARAIAAAVQSETPHVYVTRTI